MLSADRAAFLDARRGGVGGSDIASLYDVGYGCRLRLWRDKRNQPKDFPDEQSGPMELGTILEPYFADKYAEKTGRRLQSEPRIVHPDEPHLGVNIDRSIFSDHRPDPGVAEIKSMGRSAFAKAKREGLAEDYLLQLQAGMSVTGRQWGSFIIGSRDSGDLLWFDVGRNGDICAELPSDVSIFWSQVENGPAPEMLDPDDKRCQTCCYRRSCQGAALALVVRDDGEIPRDDTLLPILNEYDERQGIFDEAEALLEETKEVLRAALGTRQAVEVAGRKVYHRPQTSRRVDSKMLASGYPDIVKRVLALIARAETAGVDTDSLKDVLAVYGDFKKESVSTPLRIY